MYFVYLDEFCSDWKELFGPDTDDEALWALEILIMSNPLAAPVVAKTGGLRKLRFGKEDAGKRGGARICYAYFPNHNTVLMLLAYGKNNKAELTNGERAGIKKYLEQVESWLDNR